MKRAGKAICLCLCALLASEVAVSLAEAQSTGQSSPSASPAEIVVAQDNRRVRNFFRRLFRPREIQRESAPILERLQPRERTVRPQRRGRSAAPRPQAIAAVEKAEDAKRVLVVGDFLATALAKGLSAAYRENPNALVIDATSGSSGLVRNDYYDWPAKLPGIVEEQNPDAILVLVGGNDRQGIDTPTGPYALGTDGWRTAYAGRVNALVDAIGATAKPALWVGLVPVQSSTMSRDYSTFNGIVREQIEAKGLPFIETWNGFANAEGKYVSVGPDYRGQSVQLRASDGLNFTRAGQRKLAFFVEQRLDEIFGGIAPQLAAADAAALEPGEEGPQIGPMVPLDALAAAGGDSLATGATQEPEEGEGLGAADAIAKRLAGEEAPPAGRIDFYKWPPPVTVPTPQPAAATTAPAQATTTSASPAAQ